MLELVLSDTFYFDSNEPLKKPDTRAVKPERRVQSGCEAERYPRLGTGGSPARLGSGGSPAPAPWENIKCVMVDFYTFMC